MEKIEILTREQLENPKILKEITEKTSYLLQYDTGIEGDKMVEFNILRIKLEEGLRKFGSELSQDLQKKYLDLLIKISFVQMFLLSEAKILDLLKKHLVAILRVGIKEDIKIEEKIRAKVFGIPNILKRDPFLKDIKDALKENIETLGDKPIKIKSEAQPQKPSVKNWLIDYDNVAGAGEHGEIDISNYLFKSKNVRSLSAEDKQILKKILVLYERLKLDKTHPNSFSVYPISLFGIKSIGTGLDQKYMPIDPKEYKEEMEKRRKARAEKKQLVRGEKVPERQFIGREGFPEARQVASQKKSDFELKKEKKFSSLTSIPKISLAKLSTTMSLQKLTVEDFRNYGKDAESAGAYMSSKIKKLTENLPENKEAIKYYLRRSELYKIYLLQGQESLDSKKDIEQIAKERKDKGEKYLSKEEFEVLRGVLKAI